jgi:bisanhydrobacterioruberin hydratase
MNFLFKSDFWHAFLQTFEKRIYIVWSVILLIGAYGMAVPRSQMLDRMPAILWFLPLFILLFHPAKTSMFYFKTILLIIAGWSIEVLGVHGGILFGKYGYGNLLGAGIMHVPLVMGAVWLLQIYLSLQAAVSLFVNRSIYFIAMIAAAIMTAMDAFVQLPAIIVGLWSYAEGIYPPWFHSIAYFSISYFLCLAGGEELTEQKNPIAKNFLKIIVGFSVIWYILLLIFR